MEATIGHGRGLDLLGHGQLAQGGIAQAVHTAEGHGLGRREPGQGLLAQPAVEAGDGHPEPGGQLFVNRRLGSRRLSGRRLWLCQCGLSQCAHAPIILTCAGN